MAAPCYDGRLAVTEINMSNVMFERNLSSVFLERNINNALHFVVVSTAFERALFLL